MSHGAVIDFLAALALMLVAEGMVFALFSRRLPRMLEQMQSIDPEQLRWAGLAMAVIGTLVYLYIRS